MSIEEKIKALESCLIKSGDLEYSAQVEWGNDVLAKQFEMFQTVNKAKNLFLKGKVDKLDPILKQQAYVVWDKLLDSNLSMFPEYQNVKEEKTNATHTM